MSLGAWTWHKTEKDPEPPKKNWRPGDRVRFQSRGSYHQEDSRDQFSGVIQEVREKYLLIMTDYGYRTCVNIYEAEKYMEEL